MQISTIMGADSTAMLDPTSMSQLRQDTSNGPLRKAHIRGLELQAQKMIN